jgi:hypothetical protein
LQRFTQIVLATAAVAVIAVCAVLLVTLLGLGFWGRSADVPSIPVAEEGASPREKPEEAVVLCIPTAIRGTSTQLIGVAILDSSVPQSERVLASGGSYDRTFSAQCKLGEGYGGFSGRIQNVLVWPRGSPNQQLLFDGRVLVNRFIAPGEDCEKEESLASCSWLYWEIRESDTSGDGRIDSDDALVPYISSLDGTHLRRLTSEGSHLVSIARDVGHGFFLQSQADADGDGIFGPKDPVTLLAFEPQNDDGPIPAVSKSAADAAQALLR